MIRFSRALKENTTYAATFVSFIALVACGATDDRSFTDPAETSSLESAPPGDADPTDTENGVTPPGDIDTAPPEGMTSGEQNPVNAPLVPTDTGDDGEGTGSVPPVVTPPVVTPPVEPPPVVEPRVFVENSGEGCAVPALPAFNALPTIATLPDPFTKLDGARIATQADWRCRREEIKQLVEQYVYGDKPAKPEAVTGTVSNTSISVNVSHQGSNASFTVTVQLPTTGSAPFPALFSVGGFSQNALVQSEGVAIINFDPFAVGTEAASRENKQGAFYTIYGAQSTSGLLAAWAWGVSRVIDVIEQSDGSILKVDALAAAGCSRFGKATFAIGALDERIALTIPFESGSAGVPIWRGIPGEGAQSPTSAFGEQHWLGDAFQPFSNQVTRLPVDMHEVVAMVAPRGLLILDNPHIANLGPLSAHVSALAGAEVYTALGARENISYHSAVQDGAHCSARTEHQEPLRQNLRKFLLETGTQPGAITAAAATTGNLAEWRDWTTPTLN